MKVAFVGLGVMGFHMAGHLASAGHTVAVFNRTVEKAKAWSEKFDGRVASSPADACLDADFALCCVGDDPDVDAIVAGEAGMLSGLKAGAVLVDHTTTSAKLAVSIYERAKSQGIGFLDAPVSGGEAGAQNGALTVMCGGDADVFDKTSALFEAYAKQCRLIGPAGSGQLAKMVNQICIAGLVQGLSEGVAFGLSNGLDMDTVIDVISKGAAQSWQMDNRAATMAKGEYDFGFAVDWMRKDLRICLEQARTTGTSLPVAALVDQFYAEIQARGGGRWDTSSLIDRLTKT